MHACGRPIEVQEGNEEYQREHLAIRALRADRQGV